MTAGRRVRRRTARAVLALLAVLLASALSGCRASNEAAGDDQDPVTLTRVADTDRYQVTLSQHAISRLGIRTETVRTVAAGTGVAAAGVRASVPYAAVVYGADGSTWAYVVVATGTYVRSAIGIASIEGDTAYLTSGPAAGSPVVVVGAPELLGAEYRIAGEE